MEYLSDLDMLYNRPANGTWAKVSAVMGVPEAEIREVRFRGVAPSVGFMAALEAAK